MTTLNQPEQNITNQNDVAHNMLLLVGAGDAVAQQPQANPIMQFCTVMVDSLNIRTMPTSTALIVASYPRGTVLNFTEVVPGEFVQGNPYWGHSVQNHYYWMGGTDRPKG